ncbi:type IV secretion system protein VirB10 [Variovorax boronicumulans]|uniref:Type IV secretion system protein VirB10 n=1 Tax=Variovorax boronicumulans TaxID=436515 RepID=A0AAW8DBX9_9BURK|nr:type IV secretion system protein VirB10 [Variovorax boronicumulans]MDP9897371.1 type IV secretion system protein VirB10 [Variovorax boronicumulans]MDQ0057395.1 type IV secretion system protein VirB10 [Variovorax boronicumulans]
MSGPHKDDDHLAYAEEDEAPSPVETQQPFRAEVAKRTNTRALIAGLITVGIVIAAMVIGGILVKNWRESWAAERAAKDKTAQEKLAADRRGKRFEERPEPAPVSDVPMPKVGSVPPLPTGVPASPTSSPTPAAPPPKPVPPPMMEWGEGSSAPALNPVNAAAAAAAAANAAAGGMPAGGRTVQSQAGAQAAGKPATATLQASAASIGDRSYVLARGGWIPCILETQLNSSVAGNTSCVIPEDVYSDDGKVVLIEKGSRGQGSFGNTLKVGDKRIAVMWSRIKTTRGVVVDVESPAADGVGTTGAGGYVDNHWLDRIGAAVLLSFVEDGMAYATARAQNSSRENETSATSVGARSATNVFLPSNSIGASRQLAEKVLDSTINIAPTLQKNRGDRIMIFVNRDLWFDSTYKLVKAK